MNLSIKLQRPINLRNYGMFQIRKHLTKCQVTVNVPCLPEKRELKIFLTFVPHNRASERQRVINDNKTVIVNKLVVLLLIAALSGKYKTQLLSTVGLMNCKRRLYKRHDSKHIWLQ